MPSRSKKRRTSARLTGSSSTASTRRSWTGAPGASAAAEATRSSMVADAERDIVPTAPRLAALEPRRTISGAPEPDGGRDSGGGAVVAGLLTPPAGEVGRLPRRP